MLWTPSENEAQRGRESASRDAGDLLQERAGLVGETVILTGTDAGGIHRQTAGHVRVVGSDDHAPVAVGAGGTALVQDQLELRRTLLRPGCGALVPEHLQLESVRMAGGDPGHLDDAGAVGEGGTERGVVVVLDRLVGVADLDLAVPDDPPRATGRSVMAVVNRPPLTSVMSPARNSARYAVWLPMSARAPEPGAPL